jgi:hypothetical protein
MLKPSYCMDELKHCAELVIRYHTFESGSGKEVMVEEQLTWKKGFAESQPGQETKLKN